MQKTNTITFSPEELEKGCLTDFLNYISLYNQKSDDSFLELHITYDGLTTIIEFIQKPISNEWGGSFQFVDEDQVIMQELYLPDNSYQYVFPEEVENTLDEWLKQHPSWQKTSYGSWTNVEENNAFDSYLESSGEIKNEN